MTSKEIIENELKFLKHNLEKAKKEKVIIAIKQIEREIKLKEQVLKDLEELELYKKVFPKMQEDGTYYKTEYYKQQEILEILKENAILNIDSNNKDVQSIQINITTCNERFNQVKEMLDNDK